MLFETNFLISIKPIDVPTKFTNNIAFISFFKHTNNKSIIYTTQIKIDKIDRVFDFFNRDLGSFVSFSVKEKIWKRFINILLGKKKNNKKIHSTFFTTPYNSFKPQGFLKLDFLGSSVEESELILQGMIKKNKDYSFEIKKYFV